MKLTSATLESQLEKVRDLEGRLPFQLAVVSKLLDKQAAEYLKGTPLNLSTYRILSVVETFEEISISDISGFNEMDRAQVSRSAVELEKLGLVEFHGDPRSRRKKLVALTDDGRAMLEQVKPPFEARIQRMKAHLGPEMHESLSRGLRKLIDLV